MKIAIVLLVLISATSAVAESEDLTTDADSRSFYKDLIEHLGGYCPVPLMFEQSGEDGRGKIARIDCSSVNGKNRWSLRLIMRPNIRSRIEPW